MKIPKFKIGEWVCFYARLGKHDEHDKLYLMQIVVMRYFENSGWKYDCEGDFYVVVDMPEGRFIKVIK